MRQPTFDSPLAVRTTSRWHEIDFRRPSPTRRHDTLAAELDAQIWRIADLLPAALGTRARDILHAYPGPDRRFIDLFHRPVWSVLAWLDAEPGRRAAAIRAHALALFIHLWDDHLCDGQLTTDIVTLQIRSLAWREMEQSLADDALSPRLLSTYLDAIHGRGTADSLESHLRHFTREIAIWRAAPLGLAAPRGERMAVLVDEALTQFCLAWRLIDDIQDLDEDRSTGQDNSVRLVMDAAAAARWDAGRGIPPGAVPVDQGCLDAVGRVLDQARGALARAGDAAAAAGLAGWAEDIAASRGF